MDIYSTRAQLAAIEQMPREYPYLHDAFARDAGTVEDDKAIYDYRKGSRRMAPVVHHGTGGVIMERDGYQTREIGFCDIAPERVVENSDLMGRAFGEAVLGAMTPEQRERKLLAQDQAEMLAAIDRRIGWMVRQVLLTGKLDVFRYTNEGRDLQTTLVADYGFTNFFTPDTAWNQAGATIDADMKAIFDLVYDGLGFVDKVVMAPDVANALLANETFMKTFDRLRANMGEMNAKYRGQGLRFLGYNADGVEMYSLSGTFVNDAGQTEQMIPSGKLIAGSADLLNVFYGPVTQVDVPGPNGRHITYMKKVVPYRYADPASNAIKNRLTSRPTVVPQNVDGWAVATVLS